MPDTRSTDSGFRELIDRIRSGDETAAAEVVRRYELAVRVAVRTRLSAPALRRQLDSMDMCQSVLASFFVRAAAGQYELHEPRQLVALLTRMAQKKVAMQARLHFRKRRKLQTVYIVTATIGGTGRKMADGLPLRLGRPDNCRQSTSLDRTNRGRLQVAGRGSPRGDCLL